MNRDDDIDLDAIAFYFDAVAKDRYDQGVLSRRHGQVLALREKLLQLPEGQFDLAIKTIQKMVTDGSTPTIDNKQRYELQKQAKMLYERVESGVSSAPTSPEAIRKV